MSKIWIYHSFKVYFSNDRYIGVYNFSLIDLHSCLLVQKGLGILLLDWRRGVSSFLPRNYQLTIMEGLKQLTPTDFGLRVAIYSLVLIYLFSIYSLVLIVKKIRGCLSNGWQSLNETIFKSFHDCWIISCPYMYSFFF